jgi:ceramide glucosyltransferase
MSSFIEIVATICLVWGVVVLLVECIGIRAIFRHFSQQPAAPISPKLGQYAPHVTIIRPVKGLEPRLYECIASTFYQQYPSDKISVRLCVDSTSDPAYPVLKKLVEDFPGFDAKIMIEAEDPVLVNEPDVLGPNPKIRNISRAYREAGSDDIIWIADCNVWVPAGALGRMVDKLMGYTMNGNPARPYKFVHQLPVVVDTMDFSDTPSPEGSSASPLLTSDETRLSTESSGAMARGGGRLDEIYMATTHAKFYGAINDVGIAPCIVGKSNMFRKSHLDEATAQARRPGTSAHDPPVTGVDFFSWQICEDHLIGELLWNHKIPGFSRHALVWGDLAVQPTVGMSVAAFTARRARWLRARKFTVLAATLVEPGVESFLCSAYLAFALTTLPWFHREVGIPQSWTAMATAWLVIVTCWMTADWFVFNRLHEGRTMVADERMPSFAAGICRPGGTDKRRFLEWLPAWLGRECLALPIWFWAVLLGRTVSWRGKDFRVLFNTTVVELPSRRQTRGSLTPEVERGVRPSSKDRRD